MTSKLWNKFFQIIILIILSSGYSNLYAADKRGLIASTAFNNQPMKGVFFFPGNGKQDNLKYYTINPLDQRHLLWDSDANTRSWILDQIVATNANTLIVSYWGKMVYWSPMKVKEDSFKDVVEAAKSKPLLLMPAIESGYDPNWLAERANQWSFSQDFNPTATNPTLIAPKLVNHVGILKNFFEADMNKWLKLYDKDGNPRYIIQLLHVASNNTRGLSRKEYSKKFIQSFDLVAEEIYIKHGIKVGFTLDAIGNQPFSLDPLNLDDSNNLKGSSSIIAIQGFVSEVYGSPSIKWSAPNQEAINNNILITSSSNRIKYAVENIFDWKNKYISDWAKTELPIFLDISNGFDGRIVWKEKGTAYWGDNQDGIYDNWRNWMNQLRNNKVKGIVYNTWNGYTEGFVAVPSIQHGNTPYQWLTNAFQFPPGECNHQFFINGRPTYDIYGAICQKWLSLGADRMFGAPSSRELASASKRGRVQYFGPDKAIFWGQNTGAYLVKGIIFSRYKDIDTDSSCLGLPISDEMIINNSYISNFENGQIKLIFGEKIPQITCR
ncbi:LGFP repeat-containing protein [Acinetobacter dispersus]|uniref:LGFP repeat-containing protein n=1 Tax=Acinetobacter dispersus TaxID=70348 RepID=UPI00132EEC46|nr:hypothetical protein [Acinetobacter dispersus]QHH98845.1 hypothetical protein FPL17_15335 [Acinetobacter dispersus]